MKRDQPQQPVVEHLEIDRYMGRWYVIASIPTMFETDAVNAIEDYSWNKEKKQVDIDFHFNKNSVSGTEKHIKQTGFIYDEKTNAEWRIQPFWPLKFAYLVVDLAPDYSYVVVGVPGRDHVWIMARKPTLDLEVYNRLVAKIQTLGYKIDDLKKVPQIWP